MSAETLDTAALYGNPNPLRVSGRVRARGGHIFIGQGTALAMLFGLAEVGGAGLSFAMQGPEGLGKFFGMQADAMGAVAEGGFNVAKGTVGAVGEGLSSLMNFDIELSAMQMIELGLLFGILGAAWAMALNRKGPRY